MFVHWHAIATGKPSPAERGQHVGSDDGNADRQQTQRTTTISGRMGLGREQQGGWCPTGGVLGWRARCFKVHPLTACGGESACHAASALHHGQVVPECSARGTRPQTASHVHVSAPSKSYLSETAGRFAMSPETALSGGFLQD